MISEKPSLYLKPEAYKTDVVYCQLPEGSIGNMTFARTSVATRVDKNGLVEEVATGIPRLDYTNDSCPELLLEPTRTNVCLRSEEFDNAVWTKSSVTVTANASVSPDGTKSAERIVGTGTGDGHTFQVFSGITSGDVIFSVYLKGRGVTRIRLQESAGDFTNYATLNITLTNDWTRYEIYVDKPSDSNGLRCIISDIQTSDDFYMWGGQLEQNDYSTSYIKTTTASVTRATEECNSGGDSTTFGDEGVLYAELSVLFANEGIRIISISDSTLNNRVHFFYDTLDRVSAQITVAGGLVANMFYDFNTTENHKVAVKWKLDDFALWVNGIKRDSDSLGAIPPNLDTFQFDNGIGGTEWHGKLKDIRVYKTALTDAELTELTTI